LISISSSQFKAEDEFGITSLKNPSEPYKPFGSDLTRQEKVNWLIKNVDPEAEVTIPSPYALQNMLDSGREDLIDHFWEIHTGNIGSKPVVNIDTSDLKNPELVKFMMEREARKPKLVDPDKKGINSLKDDIDDPEEFAIGGRVGMAGGGPKIPGKIGKIVSLAGRLWKGARRTGDTKYDAQMVAEEMAENLFKKDFYDLPQSKQIELYGVAYDNAPRSVMRPKGGIIDISDPDTASDFANFAKKNDPEGYKKIEDMVDKMNQKYKFTGNESMNDLYELERLGKITRDDMNVYDPRYIEYLDAQIINKEQLYTRKEWEKTPETIKNKTRGRIDPDWEEANFGEEVNWDQIRSKELNQKTELAPEQQAEFYKQKIRDEFSGVIDETLMKQVEVDDNPQRLAEVYASIKEGLVMQQKGITPEEIIRVMKQTPRTKNSQGGLNYLMGL